MKIILIEEYNPDYPNDKIICLNDYSVSDIEKLIKFLQKILVNNVEYNLSMENFIYSSINLTFRVNNTDIGIIKEHSSYICSLTLKSYEQMIQKLYLYKNRNIYNEYIWLYDVYSTYDLLISNSCIW